MPKYIIWNPDTGDIVYMGGKPFEPLTPKKQSLIDSGYEIKQVVIPARRELPSDNIEREYKDGKLEGKSDAEIEIIRATKAMEREKAEIIRLRQLKADLETV